MVGAVDLSNPDVRGVEAGGEHVVDPQHGPPSRPVGPRPLGSHTVAGGPVRYRIGHVGGEAPIGRPGRCRVQVTDQYSSAGEGDPGCDHRQLPAPFGEPPGRPVDRIGEVDADDLDSLAAEIDFTDQGVPKGQRQ